ncbi:MAG: NADH-quinone oxidoreductase subunit H [Elusimicrobia bacterium]|nr:NADH-quinone oxidoreductase subunit H [Elusimicrobiota bacterium]MBU2614418.1 NADH-quinone oxidoreductase subunit H [Elusimicrobiota bacterium]
MRALYNILIFPGFLFAGIMGMFASYVDRKVSARVQWRKGPPLFQPVYDFVKLLGKEINVPAETSALTFLSAPFFGLAAITLVSTIVWNNIMSPQSTFVGDLIAVVYLLSIPSIAVIIGGFASNNPMASIGASREMKLILSYEMPFILSILVPVIKAGSIRIGDIVAYQLANGVFLGSAAGIVAFISGILCVQAKLCAAPFDIPDAEQEIIAGPAIEYSGLPLGIFKLTKWMMLFVIPSFLVALFMPAATFFGNVLRYIAVLVIIILIKNTNPRIKINQAVKFFWTWVTGIALLAIVLVLLGL